jgi:hypothetical protein
MLAPHLRCFWWRASDALVISAIYFFWRNISGLLDNTFPALYVPETSSRELGVTVITSTFWTIAQTVVPDYGCERLRLEGTTTTALLIMSPHSRVNRSWVETRRPRKCRVKRNGFVDVIIAQTAL